MAQLLQCDRCFESTNGHIKAATFESSTGITLGTAVSRMTDPGGPTVAGWVVEHSKLLCPQCKKNLDSVIAEFLRPRPIPGDGK